MTTIHLQINNREVEAEAGMTILEAAKANGIHIPTLCYLKDLITDISFCIFFLLIGIFLIHLHIQKNGNIQG